jgi:hypothetical protein
MESEDDEAAIVGQIADQTPAFKLVLANLDAFYMGKGLSN